MTGEGDVEELLANNPALASPLEELLSADDSHDRWEFDDVPVDSGQFGKLVERGVVEKAGNQYRLANPEAVRTAMDRSRAGDGAADDQANEQAAGQRGFAVNLPAGTRIREVLGNRAGRRIDLAAIAVLVATFVAARSFIYAGIFQRGRVVLAVNDPYNYRNLVEQLLALSSFPLDVSVLWRLPDAVANGEPLYVVTMWFLATLVGGSTHLTGVVLAWYPVVAAAVSGILIYALCTFALGDRRVGFVAGFVLAISPGYATRTPLGYADHHPFDYFWLAATIAVLVWILSSETGEEFSGRERRLSVLLGVALAGQTLSWDNSPVLLVPVVVYLAFKVLLDVSQERSPIRANRPLLVGLGIAAAITAVVHLAFGWLTAEAVIAVIGLSGAGGGFVVLAEGASRRDITPLQLGAIELGAVAIGLGTLLGLSSSLGTRLLSRLGFLVGKTGIGETGSLLSSGYIFGLELFGVFLLVAVAFMFWGIWRSFKGDAAWLAMTVYAWYFLALSTFQSRFMGELAIPLAVFSGVGFVWLLARAGLWTPPTVVGTGDDGSEPSGRATLSIRSVGLAFVCLLLVSSVSLAYLEPNVGPVTHDEETVDTALWMDSYADRHDWDDDGRYVFTRWSVNRVHNYFVSGNARSYGYARSNYERFIYDDDPGEWYRTLRDRVGFIVIEPLPRRPGTIQSLLYTTYGARFDEQEGVSHYRAVYASSSERKKVFVLVPGARITGKTEGNATVELKRTVEIPNTSFTYRRVVTAAENGTYRVTVPYPGQYQLTTGNVTRTVTVPESAVTNGTEVSVAN